MLTSFMSGHRRALWSCGCALLFAAGAHAQVSPEICGPIAEGLPDYRAPKDTYARQIEGAHFPPQVELLIKGARGSLGGDLNYTIARIPNHHRALVSIMRLGERLKQERIYGLEYPVECYFERALRFRPDDAIVRMIYSQYLSQHRRDDEAVQQLQSAAHYAKDNPATQSNIGLLYFDMKRYDAALEHAHIALDLGYLNPELERRLKESGKWREPGAAPAAPAASAGASTSPASGPAQ